VVIIIYNLNRYKKLITLFLVALIIICGIVYKNTTYSTEVVLIEEEGQKQETVIEEKEDVLITVYVCGSVKTPVNVSLPKDSRVEDAIKLAGGTAEDADLNAINMAQKLADEDMVYVPKKGEILEQGSKAVYVTPSPAKGGKININRATAAELDSLPGIGPSIAQKIIDYRVSSGGFKTINELNNVSGIGAEKFKDIKPLITVD
jgi:competence protein ComEA